MELEKEARRWRRNGGEREGNMELEKEARR